MPGAHRRTARVGPALFAVTAFSSALLLFLVQPMVGRLLLAPYGGSPAVWTTCLVFFQSTLFLGYLCAHLGAARLGRRAHIALALGLAVVACTTLPFAPVVVESAQLTPQLHVFVWLATQVALAFAVLSTTAPTLARWWMLMTGQEPYRLYAVSNAGSLLALVAYPLVVEPCVDLSVQTRGWALAFALTVVGVGLCAACVWADPCVSDGSAPSAGGPTPRGRRLLWLCLSAVPSVMLLAITNHITIDVAAGPLLWVLPLFLYLLSFVLVFGPLGHRGQVVWAALWVVSLTALGMNLFMAGQTTMVRQVIVACAAVFSCSMLCHGELVRHRPAAHSVTSFYLWMSAGGALGGLFAGLAAPQIFSGFFELQLAVLATLLVLLVSLRQAVTSKSGSTRLCQRLLYLGIGIGVPVMLASLWLGTATHFKDATVLLRKRGFFGLVQVTRFPLFTVLTHGRIRHGMQWNDPARRHEATMYFAPSTAVAEILSSMPAQRPCNVGILGLGVGTLATYGRVGDAYWFFEIDPSVVQAAWQYFSYLKTSKARVNVVLGDGRTAVAAHTGPLFDVLVLDAFSSDAVPTHLLTTEAFEIYARHLTKDGVLLANVSNRHLQVERVVAGAARHLGWQFSLYETDTDLSRGITKVRWAVLAPPLSAFPRLIKAQPVTLKAPPIDWTDGRSSLFSILR